MTLKKPWSKKQKLLGEFDAWRSSMSHDPEDRETMWNECQGKASQGLPCLWCLQCRLAGYLTCIACGQAIKTQKKLK